MGQGLMEKREKRIDSPMPNGGREIEKIAPRNTRYNETVRANNKRLDRGESPKALPRGKAGDKAWRGKKRGGSR